MTSRKERTRQRYEEGNVPWDAELPPPEVQALVPQLPPGRALDLGCGYGRSAIYLARAGWEVDAVDFVGLALEEARRRARAAGVDVRFYESSVTDLSFLDGPYDLALDIGCGHGLDDAGLRAYHCELRRLLHPGARFLFFGRVQTDDSPAEVAEEESGPPGLDEARFRQLFTGAAGGFVLEHYERGVTEMEEENTSWASAWFWLRRVAEVT